MAKQTKKATAFPTVTGIGSESILIADSNGLWKKISLANLKTSLGIGDTGAMYDGIFICNHQKSDNYPRAWRPDQWTAQQNAGEVANGVLLIEGGRQLVIAPTEGDSAGMLWSSSNAAGGAYTTSDRLLAQQDFAGKANTAAILSHFPSDGESYAPKFCATYARSNGNGSGMLAGSWWLPSLGELFMIFANLKKINYALSLITGATQIPETYHWSSTEYSANIAWNLYFNNGYQYDIHKSTNMRRVRPVSAFIR